MLGYFQQDSGVLQTIFDEKTVAQSIYPYENLPQLYLNLQTMPVNSCSRQLDHTLKYAVFRNRKILLEKSDSP